MKRKVDIVFNDETDATYMNTKHIYIPLDLNQEFIRIEMNKDDDLDENIVTAYISKSTVKMLDVIEYE